jgi:hypothetical protein
VKKKVGNKGIGGGTEKKNILFEQKKIKILK